jgi:NADH-quinone oxidoreductase subunit G/NADP-reducing hydrogenase subunit HndD
LTIDGREILAERGSSILAAAREAGIAIPTLCHHPDQRVKALCRVCVVEVERSRTLQAACAFPVAEGMVVRTQSPTIREARRTILELIIARHPLDCLQCARNLRCELQTLAERMGVRDASFHRLDRSAEQDASSPSLIRDPAKCIVCRRCVETCQEVQQVGVLFPLHRGADTTIGTAGERGLQDAVCTMCGQCSLTCPTGAIVERDHTRQVWEALGDPKKHVVVQTAPATRVTIGEEFGMEPGSIVTGKLVAALRRLGFDRVFDTDFTADLTILEEAHELLDRVKGGGVLPLITSCSPGWVKYVEHFFPQLLPNVSSCKSPQQMFGALAKTYYAQRAGIEPADIYVVSVMPCTAKKFEAGRPEMTASGYPDVDAVLTSRELGRMLREAGIDFFDLPEEDYDLPLGISTGAGAIFGATGGVMEAALRTAYETITGRALETLDITAVRGLDGIKEAVVEADGLVVKAAVGHGLGNARKLCELVAGGTADYHFIEIMGCPGGCIGGGGQPIPTTNAIRRRRMDAIYEVDRNMPIRKSHENQVVKALYAEFLGRPLGEKSHKLLHTHYQPRERYPG